MDKQATVSAKTYIWVALLLVALTIISTILSSLNLGYLNDLMAVGVAVLSALIVLSKFMNIKLNGGYARLLFAGVMAMALLIFFVAFVG
ncbi:MULTISPECIES: hypothetical protein [unclassified Carboxylicivirga]|uniref:hypothetical protein n=1 Tax=Carboxylicivirga TaxID=1628153 RepID=UPI003D34510B